MHLDVIEIGCKFRKSIHGNKVSNLLFFIWKYYLEDFKHIFTTTRSVFVLHFTVLLQNYFILA